MDGPRPPGSIYVSAAALADHNTIALRLPTTRPVAVGRLLDQIITAGFLLHVSSRPGAHGDDRPDQLIDNTGTVGSTRQTSNRTLPGVNVSHGFVPAKTRPAPAPTRKGRGGMLIVVVVLAVLGVAGYLVVAGRLPGQTSAAVTNTPEEVRRIWEEYGTEYERDPQNRPSPDEIRQRANTCLAGLPGTGGENPGYAPTDRLGRATASWVCIGSSGPAPVPSGPRCTPTGTDDSNYTVAYVRGHLVTFRFGGDALRRDNGGCVNITPQRRAVNKKIYDGPETYALAHAGVFYVAVPRYDDTPFPDELYYFIFSESDAPIQAWLFDNK